MFALDPKLEAKFRQSLKRVLILEDNPAYARMLSDMLRVLGAELVCIEHDDRSALAKLDDLEPQLVISEFATAHINGIDFVRALRRSGGKAKSAPLIMVKADITPANLLEARNSGVHEMLRKPFAWQDLVKRLQNVLFKPREWIEVATYVGPCRRSFNSGEYKGARKRRNDGGNARVALEEAVRLLDASLAAMEDKPDAMMQSVMQQMAVIVPACKTIKDPKFINAVQVMVSDIRARAISRQSLEPQVRTLMASLGMARAAA